MNGLAKNSKLVAACTILHNFVIDQDRDDDFDEDCHNGDQLEATLYIQPMDQMPLGWGYLPTVKKLDTIPGTLRMRDYAILRHVAENGYCRPSHNVEHHREELYEMDDPLM
jgi:hypothetical protein